MGTCTTMNVMVSSAAPPHTLSAARISADLRIARELRVGQADARAVRPYDLAAIDAHLGRRFEADHRARSHVVVLLDAVAADAEAADQLPVPIERGAAG